MSNAPKLSPTTLVRTLKPAGVEIIDVSDRASWLKLREKDVTASVAGALFGVHEYMTPYHLWALKSGRIGEDPEESAPMKRGRLLEPVAAQLLAETHPEWRVERGSIYLREASSRIGCTPDALAVDPAREGYGIIQFKSVEASIFRRKWMSDDATIECPLWIAVQASVEAALTGASWACVAPLVVSHGVEMPIVPIPITPGLMDALRDKVSDFWRRIAEQDPYAPDYGRDGELIAGLYADATPGKVIDLTGDNQLPELAAEDADCAARIKADTERRAAIKAEILTKIGDAESALFQGGTVKAATVKRKEYTVKPTSYRRVTLKLNNEDRSAA